MLVLLVVGLASAGLSALLVRRYWPTVLVTEPDVVYAQMPIPPWLQRRFNVVFSTDDGGEARRLYEQVTPRASTDGIVQFFDGTDQRGEKRA